MAFGPFREFGNALEASLLVEARCLEVVAGDPNSPDSSNGCLSDKALSNCLA